MPQSPADDGAGAPPPAMSPVSTTAVGAKAAQLGSEVDRLDLAAAACDGNDKEIKAQRAQLSNDYFARTAQIQSRLQAGTTAGNPELVAIWQGARGALASLDGQAARLGDLVTSCTDNTAQASYLGQSIKATMTLRGAVDADRSELIKQTGRVASIQASLEATLGVMLDELNRQNDMLLVEHRNLETLAHAIDVGELLGGNLSLRAGPMPSWSATPMAPRPPRHIHTAPLAAPGKPHALVPAPTGTVESTSPDAVPAPAPDAGSTPPPPMPIRYRRHHPHSSSFDMTHTAVMQFRHHRPLLVIPLGDNTAYEHALYGAVSGVLNRRPDARFVIEASVQRNPNRSRAVLDASAAQRQADAVAMSLAAFGLPQSRVTTTSGFGPGGIRIYAAQ